MPDKRFRLHKARILSILLGLVVAGGFLYGFRDDLDPESLKAFSEELPGAVVVAAFLVLPLCGVPIRILLVLVGFRFGFVWGWTIAAFGLPFHNVAAYFITRGTFRQPVRNFLKRLGYAPPSIPSKHRVWFTAVVAAIPGPPYFTKLYLLALTDLPLRVYLGVGAPIYVLFSLVPVGVGGAVIDFDMKWVYPLTAGIVLTTILGAWLKKHYSAERMLKK